MDYTVKIITNQANAQAIEKAHDTTFSKFIGEKLMEVLGEELKELYAVTVQPEIDDPGPAFVGSK